MRLICSCCGRDINAINQDNMSHNEYPLCEDCYYADLGEFDYSHFVNDEE